MVPEYNVDSVQYLHNSYYYYYYYYYYYLNLT
jgi:hypothetical protein